MMRLFKSESSDYGKKEKTIALAEDATNPSSKAFSIRKSARRSQPASLLVHRAEQCPATLKLKNP